MQAYSYRKVLPILAKNYFVIAFDWIGKIICKLLGYLTGAAVKCKYNFFHSSPSTGFGFSDKPLPKNGFDYTLDGNFPFSLCDCWT